MSFQYEEGLRPDSANRYRHKLELCGQEICPYKLPADEWENDPKQWPDVRTLDIFVYLIKSPRLYSLEAMDNYRSLEAHTFFTSGWVQTVYHLVTKSGNFIFKADVRPSYRVTETPHHPWVAVKSTGAVITAHCDCMAGLGETCSHAGALLFKIEAAVRLEITATACTDTACQWNDCFVENVEPAKVADIKFYTSQAKEKLTHSKKPRRVLEPDPPEVQMEFLKSLASSGSCVGLSLFKEFKDRFVGLGPKPSQERLPPPLRSLYADGNEKLSGEELESACESAKAKVEVNNAQVTYVEQVTRAQANSKAWHDQRVGRITASIAGDCLTTNQESPAPSLLKKIASAGKAVQSPAISWGNAHEADAINLYKAVYGEGKKKVFPKGQILTSSSIPNIHKQCSVTGAGLFISQANPCLGASPDSIVRCNCCGQGVLEVKCPYSLKDQPFLEKFPVYIDENLQVKQNHKYFAQAQLQMYICGVSFCDFVVWTPIDVIFTRIERNDTFITHMVGKLDMLWNRHVLPELVTRRLEFNCPPENTAIVTNGVASLYCVCQSPEEGDMVGCDRCDEWFHPKCIGLKGLPKSKTWYCKACRKRNKKA